MVEKINRWLLTGSVGVSSKAMASCLMGINSETSHPHYPDDLNRCLLFLEAVPDAREHMEKFRSISPCWSALVDNWKVIERMFLDEVGLNWSKASRAPKTYALMQRILNEAIHKCPKCGNGTSDDDDSYHCNRCNMYFPKKNRLSSFMVKDSK